MKERWKDVPKFKGRYQVSNYGRLRALCYRNKQTLKKLDKPRLINPGRDTAGYLLARMGPKTVGMHRLVLTVFRGPAPKDHYGCHLDGNKHNNRLTNLRWCTPTENQSHRAKHGTLLKGQHNPASKLFDQDVRNIRRYKYQLGPKKLAEIYGVSINTIYHIFARRTWRHL